ncbi:MAG: zinc ABC transporter substrate-binding protein [Planctomycetota bacterium]|nr:zinc ABC transporter substrate-binding protein [Planctomycetota bacterium]
MFRNGILSVFALLMIASPAWLTGCAKNKGSDKFTIVCTCGMVTDIVKNIVGDKAEVVGLLGTGVDPHTHKPTSTDVRTLESANVVIYSGLHLEGNFIPTFEQLEKKGRHVIAVGDAVDKAKLLDFDEDGKSVKDPHIWMDVKLWIAAAETVGSRMQQIDPDNAESYKTNLATYTAKLQKLDDYCRETMSKIPENQRLLITAHDAFEYFAKAYGLEVRAVQGVSTESEAGIKDINDLVDLIVSRKTQAIFVEDSVTKEHLNAILEGAKSRGSAVRIGGKLFSDAMGADGTYEGTYIGMMDHNATIIARALGGSPPEKGLNGKLTEE